MSLQDLGSIGEFVGGLAVLVTLIYLAVQIRQNTRWLRVSAANSITDSYLAFNHLLGSDPDVARVFQVGLEDFESLSDAERRQFINLLRAVFGASEHIFIQHREGVVSHDVWRKTGHYTVSLVQIPQIRAWWESRRMVFNDEFRRFIDESPEVEQPPLGADVIDQMLAAAREAPK